MAIEKPSAADVKAIAKTALTDEQIGAVIDDAALIVEGTCVESYGATRQEAIVKWLTAHLIASASAAGGGVKTQRKLGDASESYAVAVLGDALKGTPYGQQALLLDIDGCLVNLGKVRVVMETL